MVHVYLVDCANPKNRRRKMRMEEIRAKCLRRCICRNVTFRPICVTDIGNLSINDFDNSLIRRPKKKKRKNKDPKIERRFKRKDKRRRKERREKTAISARWIPDAYVNRGSDDIRESLCTLSRERGRKLL